MTVRDDDVALTLVHTADWHLGKSFPGFSREDAAKLTRARLDALERVFGLADQYSADAVLCAGDLFDDPQPSSEWWGPLAARLARTPATRPIYLLPGNHDPIRPGTIWDPSHPFRAKLPKHAIVVEKKGSKYPLKDGAVLLASPCTSQAGQDDLAASLPPRRVGDERIRIGLLHGSTFDSPYTHFPIPKDAAESRGVDYLAIGDTHSFRIVPPDAKVPTVYPGAPEPTAFDEPDAGHVALVFVRRSRRVHVERHRVAYWSWDVVTVRSLDELRALVRRTDLGQTVLRLRVEAAVSPAEYEEAERLLAELTGSEAVHPKVGILELDRSGLVLDTSTAPAAFEGLPEPIRLAAEKLKALEGEERPEVIARALYNLYHLAKRRSV